MILKRLLKPVKRISTNSKYLKYLNQPINNKAFLLEAGQGKHINGNVFSMLKVLENDEAYKEYVPYLVIENGIRKEAEKKLKKYGFSKTRIIVRNSDEYRRVLATAKYLITDNSFPYYFIKREEQVYLNTWHGTPLKRLGRADIDNSTSIGNVQKNFLAADYLLFPNEYTKKTMMSDYMIDRIYSGKSVVIDYPRNDALFDDALKTEIVEKYQLEGKRILAYMPTWRGTGRDVNIKKQLDEASKILDEVESALADDELLYVNFHFLLGNKLDFSKYNKIRKFPAEYETYDFLGVCDTLISDYSSVMLDFAQTGRNVIMYIYDYEQYNAEKGFYFDIKTLPFIKAESIEELKTAIHLESSEYHLDKQFVGSDFGVSTKKMLDLLCNNNTEGLNIENNNPLDGVSVVHFGDITVDEHAFLAKKYLDSLTETEKIKTILSFENPINFKAAQFLKEVDEKVQYLRVVPNKLKSFKEYFVIWANLSNGWCKTNANEYYKRERNRIFSGVSLTKAQMFITDDVEFYNIFSACDSKTVIHKVPYAFYGESSVKYCDDSKIMNRIVAGYKRTISYNENYGIEFWENGHECKGISVRFCKTKYNVTEEKVKISCTVEAKYFGDTPELLNTIIAGNGKEYKCELRNIKKGAHNDVSYVKGDFTVTFTTEDINGWGTHNDLYMKVKIAGNEYKALVVNAKHKRYFKKLVFVNKKYNCVYIFKERFHNYRITVRPRNITDSKVERIKLALAWVCSLVTFKKNPILLYEKDCSRYEESASILYEKMVDKGHKNVRFVLDKNYIHRDRIPEKYREFIVNKFSFKHYYNLFAAKTLIASEAIAHSLEVRNMSRLFRYFVKNGTKNYVFLQHGVMYMVSLDAEHRKFFNKSVNRGKQRIVVSSKLEAQHFLDYTDYEQNDIYISGLLKFDKSIQDEDADKIVVMLTWRPWEYVQGLSDFRSTSYYKMTEEIINQIPDELKDKLVVLPHPLVAKQIERDDDNCIWQYYKNFKDYKYDDILKKTTLLITDYSSISYDAFYRGSNIIFYWKEKDDCIKNYGRSAHLMLTEELAFGDVCYDAESLKKSVNEIYLNKPSDEFVSRYRQIVEFHDGKNAERLIKMMKGDGLV